MRKTARITKTVLGLAVATGLILLSPAMASAGEVDATAKLSHDEATAKFEEADVAWTSSGGCSDRDKPNCTSFEQVNSDTVDGAISLQDTSGCSLTITGGTETGHADGEYSHWNGYKLDFGMESCLTDYVKSNFEDIGGGKWESPGGNVYYDESNHWDVTFHSSSDE